MALTDNLTCFWKLDETSGTRNDSVGGMHLTDNNTVTYDTGKISNAALFTRANSEFLSHADNATLQNSSNSFAFSVWVYLESGSLGNHMFILSKSDGGVQDNYFMDKTTGDQFRFYFKASDGNFKIAQTTGLSITTGQWYHIAGWHDDAADTVNICVDNGTVFSAATGGFPLSFTAGGFYFGCHQGNSFFWGGRIDNVAFFKRAFTSGDITSLFNSGNALSYEDMSAVSVTVNVAGSAAVVETGTVTVNTGASVSVTGSEVAVETGTATASGAASSAVSGSEVPVETGSVTITGSAQVSVTGSEVTIETGAAAVTGGTVVEVTGEEVQVETGEVEVEIGSLTLGAYEVFEFRPNFVTEPDCGQLDDHTFASVGVGAFTPWKPTERVKRQARYEFLLGSRTEIKQFRNWFLDRGQRLEGFWLPLYVNDYGLLEDASAGDTTLTIKRIGLREKMAYGEQFSRLALVTRDRIEVYVIDSVTVSGDTEIVTLESALSSDVDAAHTICCGLMLARLADDEYSLEYVTDTLARVQMNFVELPMEVEVAGTTSKPVYLYQITRGSAVWKATSWPLTLSVSGSDWQAMDINHGEISQDMEFKLDPIDLTIGTDDETNPFRDLLDPNLSEQTTVEIFETDYDSLAVDPDAPLYSGRLGECRFVDRGRIQGQIGSAFRIGEMEAPKVPLQRTCKHALFDPYCGLDADDFQVNGTITGLSSGAAPYIEADEFADTATSEGDVNWFALGRVTVSNETRFCVGQSGDRLYLNAPFSSAVEVGQQVNAWPGCDKRAGTCDAKFGNIANHLGFGLIPNRNPQFKALETPKPSGGKK